MTIKGAASGDDFLTGTSGNDSLSRNDGNDGGLGGAGDEYDRIYGGDGDDILSGGANNDTVTDFGTTDDDPGKQFNDQLDVSGLQSQDGCPDTALDVTVVDDGAGNAKLIFPEGESVVFQGAAPAQMSSPTQLRAAGIPCFTPGTLIATTSGERPIETLRVGDRVFTRDRGFQPIRWIGRRVVKAEGGLAPILIQPGVVAGLKDPLLVSPRHKLLFSGYRSELLFGESEVLVSAAHLVDDFSVTRVAGGYVTYIHLLFDHHEIIYANGAPTESYHTGFQGLDAVGASVREELCAIFPELRVNERALGDTARLCLKSFEVKMLLMS